MNKVKIEFQTVSVLRFREIKPVLDEFDFPYVIIKGEVLSLLAYSKLGQRKSNDIDILIPKVNTIEAGKILEKHGFTQTIYNRENEILMRNFSHQTTPYKKNVGLIYTEIDLNYDIFWGEYKGKKISIDDFILDKIPMVIYNCKTFSLSPLKAFIHLCLHQYKDMNSIYLLATRKKYNLLAFKDIFYLLKNNTKQIPLQELYGFCETYKIIPYIYYILFFTNILYNDPLINLYTDTFETIDGLELLSCYGLSEDECKIWGYDYLTRLNSVDLFKLIESDLTEKDRNKIKYNKNIL